MGAEVVLAGLAFVVLFTIWVVVPSRLRKSNRDEK